MQNQASLSSPSSKLNSVLAKPGVGRMTSPLSEGTSEQDKRRGKSIFFNSPPRARGTELNKIFEKSENLARYKQGIGWKGKVRSEEHLKARIFGNTQAQARKLN